MDARLRTRNSNGWTKRSTRNSNHKVDQWWPRTGGSTITFNCHDLKLSSFRSRKQEPAIAKHFQHSDDWKNEFLTCPKCGSEGTFHEGENEIFEALMDCSCPNCDGELGTMLATVSLIVDSEKDFKQKSD